MRPKVLENPYGSGPGLQEVTRIGFMLTSPVLEPDNVSCLTYLEKTTREKTVRKLLLLMGYPY